MDGHAELFRSLADATRLRLLNLLGKTGEACVCELADALRIPQYNISRHLGILLRAGLVEDRRLGKWTYYRIAKGPRALNRVVFQAIGALRREREDFLHDEERAGQRLKLRRNGLCCLGPAAFIGGASKSYNHRTGRLRRQAPKPARR